MNALLPLLSFLLEHLDLLEDLFQVITGGADKEAVRKAIRSAAIAASDAQMHAELDP